MIDIAILGLVVITYLAMITFRFKQTKPKDDGLITDFKEVLK